MAAPGPNGWLLGNTIFWLSPGTLAFTPAAGLAGAAPLLAADDGGFDAFLLNARTFCLATWLITRNDDISIDWNRNIQSLGTGLFYTKQLQLSLFKAIIERSMRTIFTFSQKISTWNECKYQFIWCVMSQRHRNLVTFWQFRNVQFVLCVWCGVLTQRSCP